MRDLKKAITEYESLDKRNGQHTFYLSDIYGIEDIAREHSGGGGAMLFNAITAALEAGYIIGRRNGMKESKKAVIDVQNDVHRL